MKLLVFGGNGFVGSNIAALALRKGWEVSVASRSTKKLLEGLDMHTVDITDFIALEGLIDSFAPNVVVNAAAIANIDYAEFHQETAYKVNTLGAINIARICADKKIKYIFLSTDAVFNGRSGSYTEEDAVAPLNYYGQTKAEAEKSILREYPEGVVLRVSLILGYPLDSGNSFVAGLEKKLMAGERITAPTAIIRTPIDVRTLANVILEISSSEFEGIFHIGCTEPVNRLRLTQMLAEKLGYPTEKIVEDTSKNATKNKALRHQMGVLDVSKANKVLKTKMPTLKETIENAASRIETKI